MPLGCFQVAFLLEDSVWEIPCRTFRASTHYHYIHMSFKHFLPGHRILAHSGVKIAKAYDFIIIKGASQ